MILVDASIWIDHLHRPIPRMIDLLHDEQVLMHDYVVAEVALGSLHDRAVAIAELRRLEHAIVADHAEVMSLIESAGLYATGLGYVDVHLLASTMLTDDVRLWTRDRRLRASAGRLHVAFDPA